MTVSPGGRPADASPIGTPGGRQNWVDRTGGLPRYMRMIAHALMRKGMTASHAIATAKNTLERLAATSTNPKVKAAAAAALAEWEANRGRAHAQTAAKGLNMSTDQGNYVDLAQLVAEAVPVLDVELDLAAAEAALEPGEVLLDLALLSDEDAALVLDLAPGDYRPPYDWKHGYIPITPAAALSKAKGDRKRAARLMGGGKARPNVSGGTRRRIAGEKAGKAPKVGQSVRDNVARGRGTHTEQVAVHRESLAKASDAELQRHKSSSDAALADAAQAEVRARGQRKPAAKPADDFNAGVRERHAAAMERQATEGAANRKRQADGLREKRNQARANMSMDELLDKARTLPPGNERDRVDDELRRRGTSPVTVRQGDAEKRGIGPSNADPSAVASDILEDPKVSREARTAIRRMRDEGQLDDAHTWFRMAGNAHPDGSPEQKRYHAAADKLQGSGTPVRRPAPGKTPGPSDAEKVKNAETMFGTGSPAHKRAQERWGTGTSQTPGDTAEQQAVQRAKARGIESGARVQTDVGPGMVKAVSSRGTTIELDNGDTINVAAGTPGHDRIKPDTAESRHEAAMRANKAENDKAFAELQARKLADMRARRAGTGPKGGRTVMDRFTRPAGETQANRGALTRRAAGDMVTGEELHPGDEFEHKGKVYRMTDSTNSVSVVGNRTGPKATRLPGTVKLTKVADAPAAHTPPTIDPAGHTRVMRNASDSEVKRAAGEGDKVAQAELARRGGPTPPAPFGATMSDETIRRMVEVPYARRQLSAEERASVDAEAKRRGIVKGGSPKGEAAPAATPAAVDHAADLERRNRRDQAARGTLEPTAADLTWAADEWKRRNPGKGLAGHEAEVHQLARNRAQDKTDRGLPRTSEAEQASERARIQHAAGEVQRTAQRLAAEKNADAPTSSTTSTNPDAAIRVEHGPDGTLVHGTDRSDAADLKAAGFKWSRNLDAWYLPRTWGEATREQRVKQLEAKLGDKVGVDRTTGPRKSAAEREAETRARAAGRAERMDARAEKRSAEAERRFEASDLREEKSGIPFGQPILVGHHSERKHRRAIERAHQNLGKGVEAQREAERASDAADRARRTAEGVESKTTIGNRIERKSAELRDIDRRLNGTSAAQFGKATGEHRNRLLNMKATLEDDIAHDKGKLDAAGGVTASKDTVKPGDFIKVRGQWYPVTRSNAKTATVPHWSGHGTDTTPWREVQEHKPAAEATREDVARMVQATSNAFPGLKQELAKRAPAKKDGPDVGSGNEAAPKATPAGPGTSGGNGAGRLDAATARRMSDDQLEAAMGRIMAAGGTDSAALKILEDEFDRRDREAANRGKGEAGTAPATEDPKLDDLTYQADRRTSALTPEVVARLSQPQLERSLSTLLGAGYDNDSDVVRRLTAALEAKDPKAARTFRKGADNLETDRRRAAREQNGTREAQKADYHAWVEQQAKTAEASDAVGGFAVAQRSRGQVPLRDIWSMAPASIRKHASPELLEWFAVPGNEPLPFDAWRAAHLGATDRRAVESLRRRREQWLSEFG